MSDKMKKVERESDLWKTRFENCNKALTDMMEEVNDDDRCWSQFPSAHGCETLKYPIR